MKTKQTVIAMTCGILLVMGSGIVHAEEQPAIAPQAPSTLESPQLSSDVVQKLDPELIYDLLRKKYSYENREDEPMAAVFVPIVFFGSIVGGIWLALLYRSRRDRQLHETLRAMVEKGHAIPPELITPPIRKLSDLRKGILALSGGIGYTVFMLALGQYEQEAMLGAGVGLIPICIGIGYLVVHMLGKKGAAV